jgi:hypothetical protein
MTKKVLDDSIRYIIFPHYGIKELCDKIIARAIELGYNNNLNIGGYKTVAIPWNEKEGLSLRHCYSWKEEDLEYDHILGDFNTLFYTDTYKANERQITVGDYTVKFLDDSIKVGCTTVDKKTIKKIAEKFFTVTDKTVENNDPF